MATSTEVLRPFRVLMEDRGFRYSRGVFLLPLTADVLGFVGFNHGRRGYPPDSASLVPTVGVRYRQAAGLLIRAGLFPPNSVTPTILTQLQSLMSSSEYIDLVVSLSSPSSYADVVNLLQVHALPFIHDHVTLESGLNAAKEGLGHYLEFTVPVFEFLLGEKRKALQSLETLTREVQGQAGEWPDHVRLISSNLAALMREPS